MRITEIFFSVQGESTHAGRPCAFVRLTGCSLRCTWCDTRYSYSGGKEMAPEEVIAAVEAYPTKLVEITGGEPLEQDSVYPLMQAFLERGYSVMLETGGHVRIDRVPRDVIKIIDIKCPDSGESARNCWENLSLAEKQDEFKFVIASRRDYEWAKDAVIEKFQHLPQTLLFSPSHGQLPAVELVQWILQDGLAVRLQLQVQKYIWDSHTRGV